MAMDGLLRKNVRLQIEALVRQGVPPVTAGGIFGYRPATVAEWMRTGMSVAPLVKPDKPKEMIEMCKGWEVTLQAWHEHKIECRKLADVVCKSEGALVAKLARTLWKASTGKLADLATSRFMFTKYVHAHGVAEPAKRAKDDDSEGDDKDGDDVVTITLPDNGRLMVKA